MFSKRLQIALIWSWQESARYLQVATDIAHKAIPPVPVLWLGDPVELPGFVLGEVPGTSDKFKMIHWGAMIILRRKLARHKPWWIGHAMVRHGVACGRYPHHNVVVLDFDDITPRQHFQSPDKSPS